MDDNGADVVRVGFELGDLFRGVVVVDSDLEIVGPADDPILASNEAAGSDGDISELEGFDDGLGGPSMTVLFMPAFAKVYLSFV